MHITEARERGNVTPIRLSPSQCTGNCNQSRACDCVPDVDEPEQPDPISAAESMLLMLIYMVSGALSVSLLVWLWRTFM